MKWQCSVVVIVVIFTTGKNNSTFIYVVICGCLHSLRVKQNTASQARKQSAVCLSPNAFIIHIEWGRTLKSVHWLFYYKSHQLFCLHYSGSNIDYLTCSITWHEKKPEEISCMELDYIIWWILLGKLHELQSRLGMAEERSGQELGLRTQWKCLF